MVGQPSYEAVADGIFRIDIGLYRPGLGACYLVRSGDRLAFIDCGTTHTVPVLLAVIQEQGLTPDHVDYVIPTHAHLDHAGGVGALMAACPRARLVAHPKAVPHLVDPAKLTVGATAVYGEEAFARDFGSLTPVPEERVTVAADGDVIDLAGRLLTFLDTPGHANHHGCLFDAVTQGWFTGDTFGISYREFDTSGGPWLFAPTTPVAFDPDAWQRSLDRLLGRNPQAMYLTHYGRVDEPQRLVGQVRQSIRELARIALGEEGRDDGERVERLSAAVSEHLLRSARAHGVALSSEEMQRLLAVDIQLNAQGLDVWLRRRERRAAEGAPAGA